MMHNYLCHSLATLGLLLAAAGGRAQAPVITSVVPQANAVAVPRTAALLFNFNQPLTVASADALQVFSQQYLGRRTHGRPAMVSNQSLSFSPGIIPYRPGETISYSVTTAAAGAGGQMAAGRTGQFTTAVGGTGRGMAWVSREVAAGFSPRSLTVGDVDGDGDLDLLTTTGAVNVRLNGSDATGSNTASFGTAQQVTTGSFPSAVQLADIDNDGDLDFLTANASTAGTVSIGLNGGDATGSNTGVFGGVQQVPVGTSPVDLATGDVDGDGDLDFVTAQFIDNTARVYLNGTSVPGVGLGSFGTGQPVAVGRGPQNVVLADVDSDGDLDLLTSNEIGYSVSVRLNGGDASGSNTGQFANGSDLDLDEQDGNFTVGDVDSDGDLDLVVLNTTRLPSSARVYLNTYTGTGAGPRFTLAQTLVVAIGPTDVRLGDLDADGDLDLVTTHYDGPTGSVAVHLNGGPTGGSSTSRFRTVQTLPTGSGPYDLVLADMDGDDDLDILTANYAGTTASLRLNGGTVLGTTARQLPAFSVAPNPGAAATTVLTTGLASAAPVQLLDALGRPVLRTTADAAGTARLVLPAGLAPGLYLVRSGGRSQRLLVE